MFVMKIKFTTIAMNKIFKAFTILLFAILIHAGCGTVEEKTNHPETLIIGHRGSGITSAEFQENTLASVVNAFQSLDGAEVDIQCSLDGTIWLFHDAGLPGNDMLCLPQASDQELEKMANEIPGYTLTRLEEIMQYMIQMEETPVLSLDVKGYFPNGCFKDNNAPHFYFDMMAESFFQLLELYPLQSHIIIETDYDYFLDLVKKNEPLIELYLLGYHDFRERLEKALERSYHGISHSFRDEYLTHEEIELARQNGLKVQLWTINTAEEMELALSWNPAFIQTGNLQLGEKTLTRVIQENE